MRTLADVCRVAASTISRLYEAQKQHPDATPVMSSSDAMAAEAAPSRPQKSTLHAFWKISTSPPIHEDSMQLDNGHNANAGSDQSRCEDCDQALRNSNSMELDQDVLEQRTACAVCQRHVCDTCAVAGHERVCLSCASGR
jgi:hypothetical protein